MRKLIVALAAIAMLAAMASPVQAAYPTEYNQKTQVLTDEPRTGMAGSEVVRTILLAPGRYGWWTYVSPRATPIGGDCDGREIDLGWGWYDWVDTLVPHDGYYEQTTGLVPHNLDWPIVELRCSWRIEFANTYTWGSALDPHF
jgi:hypothetical protein